MTPLLATLLLAANATASPPAPAPAAAAPEQEKLLYAEGRMLVLVAPRYPEAADTEGHVTLWFEMDGGRPKVSYGTRPPAIVPVPDLRNDRKPVKFVPPLYPQKLALEPNAPKAVLQVAYVAVADDGSVTGVTVAPMLYYREFEPLLSAAVRQWKYAPQPGPWCAEVRFQMTLD